MAVNSHAHPRKQQLSRLWATFALALFGLSAYFFRPDIAALKQSENLNAAFINATTSDGQPQDPMASVAILNDIVRQRNVAIGFWLAVAGGLVLGGAVWLGSDVTLTPRPPLPKGGGEKLRVRWRHVAAGMVILLLVGEASADRLGIALLMQMSPHVQFGLFVAGIAFVVWGLTSPPGPLRTRHAVSLQYGEGEKSRRRVGALTITPLGTNPKWQWALVAIVLLAFGLRVWGLHSSMRVLVDELHFVSGVLEFWKRDDTELMRYINTLSPFSRLYTYWQAETVELLGRNFLGFRAISALLGTLNVLAVYWLAKVLFDRKTGLLAALFLATFPAHLHFSRMGIVQIGDPLFGTLALAFVAKALTSPPNPVGGRVGALYITPLQTNAQMYWALGGVCLGMTQYFYEGGKLLFPMVMGVWLVGWGLTSPPSTLPVHGVEEKVAHDVPRPSRRGFGWREVAIFVLAAVLTALPLYYTAKLTEGPMTGRLTASGLPTDYWATLLLAGVNEGWIQGQLTHATAAFLVYVHMPERAVYYGGYHPFVLEFLVPLFLFGVCFVLWKRRGIVLLLWVVFTSLGSSLLVQNAVASRYVVVLPALAILVAVGLRYAWAMIVAGSSQQSAVGSQHMHRGSDRLVGTQHAASLRERFGFLRQNGQRPAAIGYRRFSQSSVLILLALILAFGQAAYYFGDHLPTFDAQFRKARLYRDVEDAMLRVSSFPAGTQAHLIMREEFDPAYNRDFLKFLSDDVTIETIISRDVTDEYVDKLEAGVHHVFLVEPDDARTLTMLRKRFALAEPVFSPYPDVAEEEQFALYEALGER